MRIVRYEDPQDGVAVDLHPRITVLGGLSGGARERLSAAAAAIPAGLEPGVGGSVEVHGVFLDLTRESLELLELHEPIDVTVRSVDLPAVPELGATPGTSETRPNTADERVAALDAERRAALEALDTAERERAELRDRLSDLTQRRDEIAADLDAARSGVDSAAPSRLLRARGELESLQRQSTAVALEEVAARRHLLETQLEALVGEADEQRRELKRLAARGTEEVRDALDAASAAWNPDLIPSAEAATLADRIEELDTTIARLEASAASGRAQLQDLTARRDRAYDALISAEAALRTPDLDAAVVDELESVHDEIFELDGRFSKLSSSRLRRRMNELRDRERELLTRLGFDTWSSYVMGMSSDGAEAERQQRYEVAKATYQFAEDELANAAGEPIEVVGELSDRQDERHQALRRANELLGRDPGENVAAALRSLQVPLHPIVIDSDAAIAHLRAELAARDVSALPDDAAELLATAREWLVDADDAASARIREVEATRLHIESEITRIAADLEALPDVTRTATPMSAADDQRVVEAEALVAREEQSVQRHRDAQRLLDELRALDQVLRGDEDRLDAELAEADAAVRDAERTATGAIEAHRRCEDERERVAGAAPRRRSSRQERQAAVDRVEWYLLARLAQQRSVSFVGSVPFVLDDPFVEWSIEELAEVLERLVRMSEVIQLILLTDDVDLLGWARALGRDHAAVIDLDAVA